MASPIEIFCCYARADQELLHQLKKHLMPLQRQGLITIWSDTDINAGVAWEEEIDNHLNTAQIILLLVSPDFIASEYCYSKEMKRAMQRYECGEARVIPIILRPTIWKGAPFGKLQALPANAKAVTDRSWRSEDEALHDVATRISNVVKELGTLPSQGVQIPVPVNPPNRSLQQASIPMIQSKPELTHRGISRRTMVLGLGLAGVAVASGGIAWLAFGHALTPIPLGTALYTYRGHSDLVLAVAWSPDSMRIASASADKTVQVWDATDGGRVYIYRGHDDFVWSVAWSPDGRYIASGSSDGTVQVWDAADGGRIYTYHGHANAQLGAFSVAWSPDGRRIASGGSDGTVQVWDEANGGHVYTYRGHSGDVNAVAWSPDGRRIASGSSDKTVQVWDATDGGHVYTYRGHSEQVHAVAWSPDGKRIASGSYDNTVQVWDAADGGHVYTFLGHTYWVVGVAWSPDGKRIASGSWDTTVQVWNAADGEHVYIYRGHSSAVLAVRWSPDGTRIASGSGTPGKADRTVQVWEAG